MSAQVRFISDLHFNHANMAIQRGFNTVEKMNNYIIEKFNSVVKKGDSTYILGDITMEKKNGQELLDKLNGHKFIVLGNHDRRQDISNMLQYVDGVCGMMKYKGYIITHCPIHTTELHSRFNGNIHGHLHNNFIKTYHWDYIFKEDRPEYDPRYINVCCEVIDYIPKTLDELEPKK